MMTKTWLLLNVALFILAAIAVSSVVGLPGELRKQKEKTAQVVNEDVASSSVAAVDRGGRSAGRKVGGRGSATQSVQDTWPDIRRGSLSAIWQKTLFNKERKEVLLSETEGAEGEQKEDELPAPPNFELIGILEVNRAKVAIIELKNQATHQGRGVGRRPTGAGGRQPQVMRQQPQEQNASKDGQTFEPTFMTAHEGDVLRETGYKVTAIDVPENCVMLNKDGLDYKLSLDRNSSNAAKRRENQNAYAQSQQDKIRAADASTLAARQQSQANQQVQAKQQGNGGRQASQTPGQPPTPPGMNRSGVQANGGAEGSRFGQAQSGNLRGGQASQGSGAQQGRFRRVNNGQDNGNP